MATDLKSLLQQVVDAYAMASEVDRVAYAAYVEQCHSDPMIYVSEFNFKEWLEAGRPTGK